MVSVSLLPIVTKSIAFFDKLKAAALCGGLFLRFSPFSQTFFSYPLCRA